MKPPKNKRIGSGRVAFLARQDAIKERFNAGYTMAAIYEDYQKELGIGYSQFVNYVNKYIRSKAGVEPAEREPVAVETEKVDVAVPKKPVETYSGRGEESEGKKRGSRFEESLSEDDNDLL